jgi:hypothetical protein
VDEAIRQLKTIIWAKESGQNTSFFVGDRLANRDNQLAIPFNLVP